MHPTRFFFLLFALFPAFLHAQAGDTIPVRFTFVKADARYNDAPAPAQLRFYTLTTNNDTVFTAWHSTENGPFPETLGDKDGVQITDGSARWSIPLPRVPVEDSLSLKFRAMHDSLGTNFPIDVAVIMKGKHRTYSYSIGGSSYYENHLYITVPESVDSTRMQQWSDSTLAMNARLNPRNETMTVAVFYKGGKKENACTDFAIRQYMRQRNDTLYSAWTVPASGANEAVMPYSREWRIQVRCGQRVYFAEQPCRSDFEQYCRLEFYIDTAASAAAVATLRFSSRGDKYYGSGKTESAHHMKAYLCETSGADREEKITFGRRFLIPPLRRPAYFVQATYSLVPFNTYAGIQVKRVDGEAGIFIFDGITALRYYYGLEGGREVLALDKSVTCNFAMGPVRIGAGTTLAGGLDRFGWTIKPLVGLSNGGVDLAVSYDLYLVGGKKFRDVSRFNFTIAIGPFLARRDKPNH